MSGRARLLRALVPVLVCLVLVAPMVGGGPAQAGSRERAWDDVERTVADPTSYVTLIGDYDEWISYGRQQLWRTEQGIEIGGSADTVVVVRFGGEPGDGSEIILSPPRGEPLAVGDYPNAGGMPGQVGRAGMVLSSPYRGCNQGDGAFTVRDITPDLSRLWVSFEFSCNDSVATVRGEIRIDSPPAEALTLLTDTVHWKASPPGRAYTDQRVFAINNGAAPVVLDRAEVTGDAFSLAADSCDVLLPGASCALDVAFDPLTRGLEHGLLRVETSSPTEPIVEIPLTGVGNIGQTYVYSRTTGGWGGGPYDTAMTPDVESFRAWATPERVTIAYPAQDYVGDRVNDRVYRDFVSFTAPPGELLEVGRTYVGTCGNENETGARIELPLSCNDAVTTGRFTVDELELHPGGTLARFRARAELEGHPDLFRTTTIVGYQAEEGAAPYPAFVRLSGPAEVPSAADVDLSASFPAGHGISRIDLYAATSAGRVLVDSVHVDEVRLSGSTRAQLSTHVSEDTELAAEATTAQGTVLATSEPFAVAVGEPARPASDPATQPATRTISLTVRAPGADVSGQRAGSSSVTQLRVRPREARGCLRLEVQRRVDGRWVARSTSGCRRTDRTGTATALLVAQPGTRLRARALWSAGRSDPRVASPWRQVRLRR